MKRITTFLTTLKTLAERVGLRKPIVAQQPTEYQFFVAEKATDLLQKIQQSDLKNRFMEMQEFLKQLQLCRVTLPSRELTGWTWYFLYENPERLDLKYPEICLAKARLGHVMDFDSFEELHAAESRRHRKE